MIGVQLDDPVPPCCIHISDMTVHDKPSFRTFCNFFKTISIIGYS